MVKHSKIILAGVISGIVAITTGLLGLTGTVIGSVLASVFYNLLSESLEEPIQKAAKTKIEREIIYLLPLVVIFFIQFVLILALLAEWGILPYEFSNIYSLLQDLLSNNLYKILGASLLVIAAYPFIFKKDLKTINNIFIVIVGFIFLARGFLDIDNPIVRAYSDFFILFDFPIAVIAFIILGYIILNIGYDAYITYYKSKNNNSLDNLDDLKLKKVNYSNFKNDNTHIKSNVNTFKNKKDHIKSNPKGFKSDDIHENPNYKEPQKSKKQINSEEIDINKSVEDIEFVSTDLWNDKKRKK